MLDRCGLRQGSEWLPFPAHVTDHRCISFMHSAGVKRVFWTNARGEWEGAKVQELVDALENPDGPLGTDVKALFVTKHEVLMLRKGMSA